MKDERWIDSREIMTKEGLTYSGFAEQYAGIPIRYQDNYAGRLIGLFTSSAGAIGFLREIPQLELKTDESLLDKRYREKGVQLYVPRESIKGDWTWCEAYYVDTHDEIYLKCHRDTASLLHAHIAKMVELRKIWLASATDLKAKRETFNAARAAFEAAEIANNNAYHNLDKACKGLTESVWDINLNS